MKYTIYCVILVLLSAASVAAQFPQAERQRRRMEASEKAEKEKEKAKTNSPAYPPAKMNIDVRMVLTNADRKDFADAKGLAVTKIVDGDPLWLYVKFNGTLERYVYRMDSPEGESYMLFLEIGPAGELTGKNHYILNFNKPDLALSELKISLSPGASGHLRSAPIFLRNAAGFKAGLWRNEIRLTNRPALPRGPGDYLAKTEITYDLSKSAGKYPGLLKNYPSMVIRGSTDGRLIPSPGQFSSAPLRNELITKLSAAGIKPISVYFVGDGWSEYSDSPLSVRQTRTTYAVFTYKNGTNCLYGIAEITQTYDPGAANYGNTQMTFQKDLPAPCGDAK